MPAAPDRPFRLYCAVEAIWDAVFADLRAARESIDFEQYIVGDDALGHALVDLLAEKAAEGVRVRFLCDAIGCRLLRSSGYWKKVKEAGGAVRFYNVLSARSLLRWNPVFHRDHRKTVLVDGRVAYVGGACFQERMRDWRDTMVRLEGEEVAPTLEQIGSCFDRSWIRAIAIDRRVTEAEVTPGPHDPVFNFQVNAPRPLRNRHLYETLVGQVRNARSSLRLTTPYFVPDRRFLRQLIAAHKRGVDVTLLVPAISDHPSMDVLSRGVTKRVAAIGIDVRYYKHRMIHAKTAIVDDTWGFVGSLNLDRLSFRINLESAIVSRDPPFVANLNAQYDRDLANSQTEMPVAHFNWFADPILRQVGRWL